MRVGKGFLNNFLVLHDDMLNYKIVAFSRIVSLFVTFGMLNLLWKSMSSYALLLESLSTVFELCILEFDVLETLLIELIYNIRILSVSKK